MASSVSTSGPTDEKLSLGLLNINSLRNKIPDVQYIIAEHQLQVLALCETKLDSTVKDSKLYIPGYRMYRRDREDNGGGVALYIQNHIPTKLRFDLMKPEVEIIWVEMKLPDSRPVLVGCCYRPPRNCYKPPMTDEKYFYLICKMINQVSNENRDIFLLGDFNFNWLAGSEKKDHADFSEMEELFSLIHACHWKQIVKVWTKKIGSSSKCIDHIYTNIPDSCRKVRSEITGCSDHNLITLRVSKKIPKKTLCRPLETFNDERFIRDLNKAQWSDVTNETDPQEALNKFKEIFISIANNRSPKKTKNIYDSLLEDEELKSLIRKRDEAKVMKNNESDTHTNTNRYNYLKRKMSLRNKKKQTESFTKQLEEAGDDQDNIHKISKRFKGYDLPFHVIDVKCDESSTSKAEFQKYLKHIQTETQNLQSVSDGFETQYEMEEETFSFKEVEPQMIKTLLSSLCESGIIELDPFEAELFRLAADFISAPIGHILNIIIVNNQFPSEWNKIRNIPCQTEEYTFIRRINSPEGVDFVLSLIFDIILLVQTKEYFTNKNLIFLASLNDEQKDSWLTEIKKRETILCYFSDFSSSFDTINHGLLLDKLESYGFSSSALDLIKSSLSDRHSWSAMRQLLRSFPL